MPDPGSPSGQATFTCTRCKQPNPRLDSPPMPGALGRRIHESICRPCWEEWFAMSVKVINEYRLNLMAPEHAKVYDRCMKEFLGLAD